MVKISVGLTLIVVGIAQYAQTGKPGYTALLGLCLIAIAADNAIKDFFKKA